MSIKLKELKKIITSPVILSLLIIFISFNFSIIYESSHFPTLFIDKTKTMHSMA
jgi:hypothetical protein